MSVFFCFDLVQSERLRRYTAQLKFKKLKYSSIIHRLPLVLTHPKMILEPMNEAQLEYIKKEDFYQSNESLEEDVTQLIEWLSKQPHLPNITGVYNIIISIQWRVEGMILERSLLQNLSYIYIPYYYSHVRCIFYQIKRIQLVQIELVPHMNSRSSPKTSSTCH